MEQGCIPVQDAGMVRKACCITVSCVAGLGVWFATVATVPTGDRVSGLRMQLLWIAMIVGAAILGYLFSNDDGLVALGMSGGPFVAAFWTAPRGDGDGLWVLFFRTSSSRVSSCCSSRGQAGAFMTGWFAPPGVQPQARRPKPRTRRDCRRCSARHPEFLAPRAPQPVSPTAGVRGALAATAGCH
jgi:hypothetical protein